MNVFEEVKARVSIRQAVEASEVKVNRRGQFVCPFHNDTHPSASIKKDFFNCFVCGSGGDCISYTAKFYGLSNFNAAKKLNDDLCLNIPFGDTQELTTTDRLRMKRAKIEREQKRKQEEELSKLVAHTGRVLADAHRILYQGVMLYPYEDIRHQRGLANLPQITYMLECYDSEPVEYSKKMRKEVKKLEGIIHFLNDKGQ